MKEEQKYSFELTIPRTSPIYIGNRNPINTTPNEPNPELLTWMKALKVSITTLY